MLNEPHHKPPGTMPAQDSWMQRQPLQPSCRKLSAILRHIRVSRRERQIPAKLPAERKRTNHGAAQ